MTNKKYITTTLPRNSNYIKISNPFTSDASLFKSATDVYIFYDTINYLYEFSFDLIIRSRFANFFFTQLYTKGIAVITIRKMTMYSR